MITSLFIALIIALIISVIVTPLTIRFFVSRKWIEDPYQKNLKTHNATALAPVPRGGGIPIIVAIIITCLVLLPFDKHLVGILLAGVLTVIIGLWDDIKDISPKIRLFTNLLAALIVVASGIGIASISSPFGGVIDLSPIQLHFNFFGPHSLWIVADLIALFWIVACMNIVGWSAGIEGQLPGFVSVSAFFIGLLATRFGSDQGQLPVLILAGAVCGSYLGFLPFNFFPQKIMPGYSGKSLAGFFLAVLAILSGAKLATMIFLLGVPIIDALFTFFRRLLKHQSPLKGDGLHLHHQLLKLGFSRVQIAIMYWIFSLILGLIALVLNSTQKFYVFLGIGLLVMGLLMVLSGYTSTKPNPTQSR